MMISHYRSCNTLQHTATYRQGVEIYHDFEPQELAQLRSVFDCNTLQYTAIHCNPLQYTATHCNTLQHTTTHRQGVEIHDDIAPQELAQLRSVFDVFDVHEQGQVDSRHFKKVCKISNRRVIS